MKDSIKNYIERNIKYMRQCMAGETPIDDSDPETTKYIAEQMESYITYHEDWKWTKASEAIDNISNSINSFSVTTLRL